MSLSEDILKQLLVGQQKQGEQLAALSVQLQTHIQACTKHDGKLTFIEKKLDDLELLKKGVRVIYHLMAAAAVLLTALPGLAYFKGVLKW